MICTSANFASEWPAVVELLNYTETRGLNMAKTQGLVQRVINKFKTPHWPEDPKGFWWFGDVAEAIRDAARKWKHW